MTEDQLRRLEQCVERLEAVVSQGDDHETRLRHLEQFKWKAVGVLAVLGLIAPYLAKILPTP